MLSKGIPCPAETSRKLINKFRKEKEFEREFSAAPSKSPSKSPLCRLIRPSPDKESEWSEYKRIKESYLSILPEKRLISEGSFVQKFARALRVL